MKSIFETIMSHMPNMICEENWGALSDEQNKEWDKWWDKYVPDSGMCDTVGGEIMRAFSRIMYRYYNDGDMVGRGYGKQTCDTSNSFLLKCKIPGYKTLRGVSGHDYEEVLCDNEYAVFDFLKTHPDMFEKPNKEDSM